MNLNHKVIIVGAGLAGLSCAVNLNHFNIPFLILEADNAVGGRIRTDKFEGFLLDRGFQVLLEDYPEARQALNFKSLDLKQFRSGSLIRYRGNFHRFFDPYREPSEIVNTLFSPIGRFSDKVKITKLRLTLAGMGIEQILSASEESTIGALDEYGFSSEIIDTFFRPFFGGIFLDRNLANSSRLFNWLFKSFSSAPAAIPRLGMEEIPKQLASQINPANIRLNCKIAALSGDSVILESGEKLSAPHIVLATSEAVANKLVYDKPNQVLDRGVTCLYYSADNPPILDSALILNGDGNGPINNLCVMSNVSPDYAPPNKALISVSVVDDGWRSTDSLVREVRSQCAEWFNIECNNWRHLRTYRIDHALPSQQPPTNFLHNGYKTPTGHYICGDHTNTASINGALQSGREVAHLISLSPILQGASE